MYCFKYNVSTCFSDVNIISITFSHDTRIEYFADQVLWLEDGVLRDRLEGDYAWTRYPVCNMRVDAKRARFTQSYQQQLIAFCSERCFTRFEQGPARYQNSMKELGTERRSKK